MATLRTLRKCPWCGETVRLALAPIVATNLESSSGGVGALSGGLGGADFGLDDDFVIGAEESSALAPGELPAAQAEQDRLVPVSGAAVLGYAGRLPIVAPAALAASEATGFKGRFGKGKLAPVTAVADPRDLPARACTHCHHPLPADIDDRTVLIISVLGINRAGKTYLLATGLADALQNGALEPAGIEGFAADEATGNRFHRDYFMPVFRKRHRLDPTQDLAAGDVAEPLVFRFEHEGTPYLLALHDLAGEAIAEPKRRAVVAPFIRHSDAVLFAVDPLEIASVRSKLPFEHVTVDWRGWSQVDVLRAAIDSLGEAAATTPVSVVLTKSDLIGVAEGKRFGFARPAPAEGWLEDQFAVDAEVRALLQEWEVPQFEDATRRTLRGFFHASSAFGTPPEDANLPGALTPVRAADPFGSLIRLVAEARSRS